MNTVNVVFCNLHHLAMSLYPSIQVYLQWLPEGVLFCAYTEAPPESTQRLVVLYRFLGCYTAFKCSFVRLDYGQAMAII